MVAFFLDEAAEVVVLIAATPSNHAPRASKSCSNGLVRMTSLVSEDVLGLEMGLLSTSPVEANVIVSSLNIVVAGSTTFVNTFDLKS